MLLKLKPEMHELLESALECTVFDKVRVVLSAEKDGTFLE
jgi:hypothetical protein